MRKLAWRVDRKKEIHRRYQRGLEGCRGIRLFRQNLDITTPWFIDALADDRDALMAQLKSDGIGTRMMYPPINEQQAYRIPGKHSVSMDVGNRGVWLPSASQLTDEQVDRVCAAIRRFYESR